MQKLVGFGDRGTSNVVARIADEEFSCKCRLCSCWFVSVCQKMGLFPLLKV
jgi:hypothetical protein